MALNVISQWTLNDPTQLARVWDNSGKGHHGDFGAVKPEVVLDSPNGSRSMKWVGSNVTLPEVQGVQAISYWMKREESATFNSAMIPADGSWHLLVVTGGKLYVGGEEKTSLTVDNAVATLKEAIDGGTGFYLSDIIFYGQELTEDNIKSILEVKTRLSKDGIVCKEFVVEEERKSISVKREGVVLVSQLGLDETAKTVKFQLDGQVVIANIIEQ